MIEQVLSLFMEAVVPYGAQTSQAVDMSEQV